MIKNEQLSSVYGLFFVGDGDERLVGVYTSEQAAQKALEDCGEKDPDDYHDYMVAELPVNQEANYWLLRDLWAKLR